MERAAPPRTGGPVAARGHASRGGSDCEDLAYRDGLAAGLTVALADLDPRTPPGRVAAIPTVHTVATDVVIRHDLAEAEGVSFVRCPAGSAADGPARATFAARLGAVRLGVTRRLLAHAIAHLSGRTVGGEPTIRKQLVLGAIADVQTAIEVARRTLRVAVHVPAAVAEVHERLTEVDWEAAKLLGGSGYVGAGPARTAYVSRLVANCWITPGVTP